VADLDADVVAVQELAAPQAEALGAVLPFGRLDPAKDFTGMGIARRSPGVVTRLPLARRDAYLTEIDPAGGAAIELVNVHVLAPHAGPPWRALATRRAQLRGLDAHLAASPGRRRVLGGDLNATPLWPVYRRLRRRLQDGAWDAVRGNGGWPRRTWGPWPGAPRLLRIDHVLVCGVTVTAVRVVHVPGSDHSALVVDLVHVGEVPEDPPDAPPSEAAAVRRPSASGPPA
jgi:endonuclease/exonuclease/phosphatase (EEP) superfamily protein YafD